MLEFVRFLNFYKRIFEPLGGTKTHSAPDQRSEYWIVAPVSHSGPGVARRLCGAP